MRRLLFAATTLAAIAASGQAFAGSTAAPSRSILDGARADVDTSSGSVPSKFQYLKPFSKEWNQRREQEARRLKAATTICRC
jgi:hypothetical protein